MQKDIVIIGAGPGGLAAGMLLSSKGHKVRIYEKRDRLGGRNALLNLGDYKFDTGPTFLMMKPILEKLFMEAGENASDYLTFIKLDPMYRLVFKDKEMFITSNTDRLKTEIEKYFPGESGGLDKFKKKEKKRFDKLYPCLESDYSSFHKMFSKNLIKALPYLSVGKSVFSELGRYYKSEDLKIAFTFQAKYLGMSAWKCPGLFTMIPFVEQDMDIYHVRGGLNKISEAMAKIIIKNGGTIHLNSPVKRIVKKGKKITGAELAYDKTIKADAFFINADFANTMTTLFNAGELKKYTKKKIDSFKYSCSTFMIYLGLDKIYKNISHHTIIFAKDYHKNVKEIFDTLKLSKDMSVYVQNPSVTDDSLAPEGKSGIYILVPVPNNLSGIDWTKEKIPFRNLVIKTIEDRTEMKNLSKHIVLEKIITPSDWSEDRDVYNGATFNISHKIMQMLYFRPHNKFEDADNAYIVSGGTHPGSGLPTIYESAKISAKMFEKDLLKAEKKLLKESK